MGDFQQYLDDALKKLDVNEDKSSNDNIPVIEYDIGNDISELILSLRKEIGISQQQLSEVTGIPQANISKIENGRYIPSLLLLKRLADGLGKRLVIDFVDIDSHVEE